MSEPEQITFEDFDNAVKHPWSSHTCIIAQAIARITGKPATNWDAPHVTEVWDKIPKEHAAVGAMKAFDDNFTKPGDENKPELQALRASLPITLTKEGN